MPLHISDCTRRPTQWKSWPDFLSNRDGNLPGPNPEAVAVGKWMICGGACIVNPLLPDRKDVFFNKFNWLAYFSANFRHPLVGANGCLCVENYWWAPGWRKLENAGRVRSFM